MLFKKSTFIVPSEAMNLFPCPSFSPRRSPERIVGRETSDPAISHAPIVETANALPP